MNDLLTTIKSPHFQFAEFKDVLEIRNGRNQKQVENPVGKYPIYGSGGIMGYADNYICEAETVVIGRKGSINNPIFVNEPFWNVDTAFGLIADREILLPKYLYYFCQSFDFEKLSTTVTIPSLTKANLSKIKIQLPDLNTQHQVICILDQINWVVAKIKNQSRLLDDTVKSRFTEMFMGDYLPVVVGDEFKTCSGGTPSRKNLDYYKNGTIPWLTSGEISKGVIREASQMITEDALNNSSAKIIPKNSVLIAMYGATAGKVGLLQSPMTTNQAICAVLPNDDFNPYYTYYAFRNLERDMVERATGGAQPNISQQIIRQLEIKKPPIDIQNQFAEFVVEVDKSKFLDVVENEIRLALSNENILPHLYDYKYI